MTDDDDLRRMLEAEAAKHGTDVPFVLGGTLRLGHVTWEAIVGGEAVKVVWRHGPMVPGEDPINAVRHVDVFLNGRKLNARRRRETLALLAGAGVTFDRVWQAKLEGRDFVAEEG